ncbi:MAG: HK97 family phage prohead protease [[Clostridium] scindens]
MSRPFSVEACDFSGWATRNDLKCSDGRVIRRDAFKNNDGIKVPLVWNHQHNSPRDVLGHAWLENREEGVYTYGFLNDTADGEIAKVLIKHGDICALSIYANQLQQAGPDVLHGCICEVSLVHKGANPGAFIDSMLKHGEMSDDEASSIPECLFAFPILPSLRISRKTRKRRRIPKRTSLLKTRKRRRTMKRRLLM